MSIKTKCLFDCPTFNKSSLSFSFQDRLTSLTAIPPSVLTTSSSSASASTPQALTPPPTSTASIQLQARITRFKLLKRITQTKTSTSNPCFFRLSPAPNNNSRILRPIWTLAEDRVSTRPLICFTPRTLQALQGHLRRSLRRRL